MASTALRPRERAARPQARHSGVTPRPSARSRQVGRNPDIRAPDADLPPEHRLCAALMKNLPLRTGPEDILHEKLATLSEQLI